MKTHWFTIYIAEAGDFDEFSDRFLEAGGDDALLGVSAGDVYADFAREGETEDAAIESAIATVTKAGGKVLRIHRG